MTEPASRPLYEWEDAAGIVIVRFNTASLLDDRAIRRLFEHLEQMIDGGRSRFILNFTGLEGLASYAIGKLVSLNARLTPPAGRLALCCLTPVVNEIIDIMSLRKRFAIYPTERAAMEALD